MTLLPTLLVALPAPSSAVADTLTSEALAPHTHRFRLEDGEFVGAGAAFVERELAAARIVLLGEYHGSKRISELTRALIPRLHEHGFRHLALEVGPTSGRLLAEMAGDGTRTVEELAAFNASTVVETSSRVLPAIPFFAGVADAEFLAEAAARDWQLVGFDQEFVFGLLPLVDRMLDNVGEPGEELEELAEAARGSIADAYELGRSGNGQVPLALAGSQALFDFLDAAASADPANRRIAEDLRTSIEIYRLNAVGDWWASNGMRIAHMKQNLARGLDETGFDLAESKLLVKVGGVHSGRGLSLLRHFEVGATMSEVAEMYGGHSLHLEFAARYRIEDGALVDELESDERYAVLRAQGRPDEWTVVDLRPLKKDVFYDRVEVERYTREWFVQHDWIVIPPADEAPAPNR